MRPIKLSSLVSVKDYIMIIFGIFLYAFGFTAFILPHKVIMGGLAGIGSLVYFFTEHLASEGLFPWAIPVAITQYICNITLLAFAYKIVGRQFVIRTIFGATVISLFIGILQPCFPEPLLPDDQLISVVIGAIFCGLGVGTCFNHNGSTGGTDIVAAMVSKKTNVTIGRVMIYTDITIISSGYFLFHEISTIVYGLMVLFIASYVVDLLINTNRQAVQFTIFSKKWEDIATAINNDAHRGCTVLSGMGWYSKNEVKVLMVMCRKIESVNIFRIIKSIDNDAFITQCNVNGVYGQGFDEYKLKMKPVQHHDSHTKSIVGKTTQET